MNFMRCSWNRIRKLLRSTKGVKKFFAVSIQARLVRTVNGEQLPILGRVRCMIFLRVVRDEPFEVSKGDTIRLVKNVHQFSSVFFFVVEIVD